jgi:hypothetical protein
MPVIIDEVLIDVQPGQQTTDAAELPVQPAESGEVSRMIELLELARERMERLRCD